jgi:hypothetical protein
LSAVAERAAGMLPQLGGTGNAASCRSFAVRQHVLPHAAAISPWRKRLGACRAGAAAKARGRRFGGATASGCYNSR